MTEKLEPCPFCGAGAYLGNAEGRRYVACGGADPSCVVPLVERSTEAEAIAAWNTRASSHGPILEALEEAKSWIEHDDAPMGPMETSLHRALLAKIDRALALSKGRVSG